MTHGDRPLRVYPVDWEMAAIGPGVVDLAAIAGGWTRRSVRASRRAYLEGSGRRAGRTASGRTCSRT